MGCCPSKAADDVARMRSKGRPQWYPPVRPNPANPIATCVTSMGTFTVEIFLEQMPITASNFIALARSNFYDGLHFHRVRLWGTTDPPRPLCTSTSNS